MKLGHVLSGSKQVRPVFAYLSTTLKPLTMPTVQISEVDMPVESVETHSPTGEQ